MDRTIYISKENSEYQIILSLKNNRSKRTKLGEIFIEGIESIKQARSAGVRETRVIYSNRSPLSDWGAEYISGTTGAKIIEMDDLLYRRLCDKSEPSELIITAELKMKSLKEIQYSKLPFFLAFDRPSDRGNFGTIVRSANSFNVDAILVFGHSIDVFDPKVIRSSLGSIFHTPVVKVESLEEFLRWTDEMKSISGMKLIGTDSGGEVSLECSELQRPVTCILGNEAKGMSIALKNICDTIVSIPSLGQVNSLNVSCAGSILLWEIYKNSRAAQGGS